MSKTDFQSVEFSNRLEGLKAAGRYRSLRAVQGAQGPEFTLDGRRVICLCSNNYLGLASHPALAEAAAEAAREFGVGAGASRLISGNMETHLRLEERLARFKKVDKVLLFNSGYHANTGVIGAVAGKNDFIYSDELNHASIIDGARLSRAAVRVFPHRDTDALERMVANDPADALKLIVTDSLFSMDGDLAPLKEIVEIKNRHNALLMIDEAHATGVMGPGGRGLAAALGLSEKVDITMGTLGKAMGCFGAFVGGSRELIDCLVNTARSFIYTTALPPPVAASAIAALDLIESRPGLVERLRKNARRMRAGLKSLGFDIEQNETPIMPIMLGDEEAAMDWCGRLLDRGVFAQAIRPPTVPVGKSRLRVTVMATHTDEHIDYALRQFGDVKGETI